MTPEERRIARAERMLIMLVRSGRRSRNAFRVEHREMNEKINILINAQIATEEQIKKTDQQIEALASKTEQALDRLTAKQAKTEEALERFLNGLSKGRNGGSSE